MACCTYDYQQYAAFPQAPGPHSATNRLLALQNHRFLSSTSSSSSSSTKDEPSRRSDRNTFHFHNNNALQRARLKRELKPMLSLSIHYFLTMKLSMMQPNDWQQDFAAAIEPLARWNGYQPLCPSQIIVSHGNSGKIPLGQGLIAEACPFASENYIVMTRPCRRQSYQNSQSQSQQQHQLQHPPFVEEDASWYRAIENKVNDNLDRWEENARKRRQVRLASAKQGLQRIFDLVQAPVSKAFGAVTIRVGPIVERVRAAVKTTLLKFNPSNSDMVAPTDASPELDESLQPDEAGDSKMHVLDKEPSTGQGTNWNRTDPEDLIILTKDGQQLMLLNDVLPGHRLLALPLVSAVPSRTSSRLSKVQPPYRLRLARGGVVITTSFIAMGAIAPTYRSLRFIFEYPRTAEIVMITLVGSVAYSLWSWRTQAKTRQRELIAAAIQSRLIARNQAALSFLTQGAVERLTDVVMEDYVATLLHPELSQSRSKQDPLVTEIGLALGLLRREKQRSSPSEMGNPSATSTTTATSGLVVAVAWEEARAALVHRLAT